MAQTGENNHNSKLTEGMVRAIRREYARTANHPTWSKSKTTMRELAERYNISRTQIQSIIHKLQWKHVNVERVDAEVSK